MGQRRNRTVSLAVIGAVLAVTGAMVVLAREEPPVVSIEGAGLPNEVESRETSSAEPSQETRARWPEPRTLVPPSVVAEDEPSAVDSGSDGTGSKSEDDAPTDDSPSGGSDLGPRPPGSVTVPYSPGQSSWSGSSGGFDVTVTMSPKTAKVGEAVTFTVSATKSGSDGCCGFGMVAGDGRVYDIEPQGCQPTGTDTASRKITHTYNKAGQWEFLVMAHELGCTGDEGQFSLYGTVDVASGVSTKQGPNPPVIDVWDSSTRPEGHEDDFSYVTISGHAHDEDGYIVKLVVDFGDGTTVTYPGDEGPCQATPSGWPATSWAWVPFDPSPPVHHYEKPGTYTLTLTAYSAACDGSEIQKGSATFQWSFN